MEWPKKAIFVIPESDRWPKPKALKALPAAPVTSTGKKPMKPLSVSGKKYSQRGGYSAKDDESGLETRLAPLQSWCRMGKFILVLCGQYSIYKSEINLMDKYTREYHYQYSWLYSESLATTFNLCTFGYKSTLTILSGNHFRPQGARL